MELKRTCADCGKPFVLSEGEIRFFNEKKLSLPKRCKGCREKRKNGGSGEAQKPPSEPASAAGPRGKKVAVPAALLAVLIGVLLCVFRPGSADPPPTAAVTAAESAETQTVSVSDAGTQTFSDADPTETTREDAVPLSFANPGALRDHFERHGREMGFADEAAYAAAANAVVNNPAALHKLEKEDGDDVYYLEETNELVVVSPYGFIRTYFCPDRGRAYYDAQ